MVHKSKSENFLANSNPVRPRTTEKPRRSEQMRRKISEMDTVVRNLECSLAESRGHDRHLHANVQSEKTRNEKLAYELEEARKDNKQLLNILQQQSGDRDPVSRSASRSQLDRASSYSSISMVHLQYKYEELIASHEGLLKVLESKIKESQKCYRENDGLRDELQKFTQQLSNNERTVETLCDKFLCLKERKDRKIANLRYERDTLRQAHNQLVRLLHKKCMDEDRILSVQLRQTVEPTRALLLNEIRQCNRLQHENARLLQENRVLRSRLGVIDTDE
ncbi:hypothetical protein Trydic_g2846 [Trypoxylus dichotomus]